MLPEGARNVARRGVSCAASRRNYGKNFNFCGTS